MHVLQRKHDSCPQESGQEQTTRLRPARTQVLEAKPWPHESSQQVHQKEGAGAATGGLWT